MYLLRLDDAAEYMNIEKLINILGGQQNIASVTNCMTRLRISVKSETDIHEEEIASLDGVLGLVHDVPCKFEIVVGPGKSRKYADICHDMGLPSASSSEDEEEPLYCSLLGITYEAINPDVWRP